MTIEQLISKRDEICYKLVEADSSEIDSLEQELMWIEELLREEIGGVSDKEN